MRSLALAFTAIAGIALGGCVSDPESPWDATIQLERRVTLLDRADVAVRVEDTEEPRVLLNIQCADVDRTLAFPEGVRTEEVCGLHFQLMEIVMGNDEPIAARFSVTWGEGADEAPLAEPPAEGSE